MNEKKHQIGEIIGLLACLCCLWGLFFPKFSYNSTFCYATDLEGNYLEIQPEGLEALKEISMAEPENIRFRSKIWEYIGRWWK